MRLYSIGQLSNSEKSDILGKHREVYNGYKRMHPEVPNEQPLYTQDFAGDKNGLTVNNKGEVKHYMNVGINEGWESLAAGAIATELAGPFAPVVAPAIEDKITDFTSSFSSPSESTEGEIDEEAGMCSECGGGMYEGECTECGYGKMDEETEEGIYDVKDLNPENEFDYTEEVEYEPMESAFSDELDEVSGPSPLYSEIDFPAYEFKSDGPLFAPHGVKEDEDDLDFEDEDTAFSRMKRGKGDVEDIDWEDITDNRDTAFSRMKRGKGDVEDIDWEEVDVDLKESFINQKNKITEMFNRINKYN